MPTTIQWAHRAELLHNSVHRGKKTLLKRCIINIYTFLHNEQMCNTLGCLQKKVQFKSLSILSESTVIKRSLQFYILVDKSKYKTLL